MVSMCHGVCLVIGVGELVPESQMMEETDSLGISALSLEGAIRAALRGEQMGGIEMLLLRCVGTF